MGNFSVIYETKILLPSFTNKLSRYTVYVYIVQNFCGTKFQKNYQVLAFCKENVCGICENFVPQNLMSTMQFSFSCVCS